MGDSDLVFLCSGEEAVLFQTSYMYGLHTSFGDVRTYTAFEGLFDFT